MINEHRSLSVLNFELSSKIIAISILELNVKTDNYEYLINRRV